MEIDRWWVRANCRGLDPDLFFPTAGGIGKGDDPREVCKGCPVIFQCRQEAMPDIYCLGIWGGMTERERIKERARLKRMNRGKVA